VATIEVFADVCCPFTHVSLRRLVERRSALGRNEVRLRVRAWPLELVNGRPLDPRTVWREVEALRSQVAPDLFGGFRPDRFPASSLPALMLAAAAYAESPAAGERASLALRGALFEEGCDVADEGALAAVAAAVGVAPAEPRWRDAVVADWEEGRGRGVVGSPYFFVGGTGQFCPSLDISHDDGSLRVTSDPTTFDDVLRRA
jgi:predicted DsbA family dithiol-disulfide isomerase